MIGKIRILGLILTCYFAAGIGYAIFTPHWQNPDEPAHYNYIGHLAETGSLPVLQMEDYDQHYLEQIVGRGFPPELDIKLLRYESHQPPLYYLLALPVYKLSHGEVLPLRIFSLTLGACLIVIAYLISYTIAPGHYYLAYSTSVIIALIPQHTAMMASINNDALAELLMAVVLLLALRERLKLSTGIFERALLGAAVGGCFLTKLTMSIAYPIAAYALLMRMIEDKRHGIDHSIADTRNDLMLILLLPILLVFSYWLRNLAIYGWPDFTGLLRHGAVVALQPQTIEWVANNGFLHWLQRFAVFTFQSFWGQFGWMSLPMRPFVYHLLMIFCGILAVSFVYDLIREKKKNESLIRQKAVSLLVFSSLLTLFLYVLYNCSFVQHQGRYLYSALVPISFAIALQWNRLWEQIGCHNTIFTFAGLTVLLVSLNLYAILGVIQSHVW